MTRRHLGGILAGMTLSLAGCGYGLAGKADLVPKHIQTIAVPPFHNVTTRYVLTDRLPGMISREFISRTRYQIVNDPENADAILRGSVLNVYALPTIIDPVRNRASGIELQVVLSLELTERATGKVLYSQPGHNFRQRYEIAAPGAYFDESSVAIQRLSQDVARSVVTGILENF